MFILNGIFFRVKVPFNCNEWSGKMIVLNLTDWQGTGRCDERWHTNRINTRWHLKQQKRMLEGRMNDVETWGWPRRNCIDDSKEWTKVKDCSELNRTAEDRNHWKISACLPSTLEEETRVRRRKRKFSGRTR